MNGVKEKNPLCRRIPNDMYRGPTLRKVAHNSLCLKCGLSRATSFQREQDGKKRKKQSNLTVEKSDQNDLSQAIKVNISSDKP